MIVLRGGMGKKQREAIAAELAALSTEKGRAGPATGRYIGEGFDDPRRDTLFLTLPESWHGTIAQYAGRLHRLYDGSSKYGSTTLPTEADLCFLGCLIGVAVDTRSLDI